MTWSLSNTITYVDSSTNTTAMQYLHDTFLPTVGWSSSAHPSASGTKRSLTRAYTNLLTGNTITNYHWVDFTNSLMCYWYEDSTYTTVPGDLGTNNTNRVDGQYNNTAYSTLDWKFWTSSERSSASLVTRGKYPIFFDAGATDVFGYEDTSWNGSTDTGTTHFYPFNHNLPYLYMGNSPTNTSISSSEGYLLPAHDGTNYHKPSVDSIIKGFDLCHSASSTSITHGCAYRITGNDIVLHQPATAPADSYYMGSAGVVVQVGSDYYYRFGSNMANTTLMLYMGTSEPDFT